MPSWKVRILEIFNVTHDVKCFRLEKPMGFTYEPGQATDVSIPLPGFEAELRPFTFTALRNKPYLEFTIKRYAAHKGVTDHLHQMDAGDELVIHEAWGAISYKGPGCFIAGGAGITPFIAILRNLYQLEKLEGNELFFANKTSDDVIYGDELRTMLDSDAHFILSREKSPQFYYGHLDEEFLINHITDFKKHFYICGPDEMVAGISKLLRKAGASEESVIFEK